MTSKVIIRIGPESGQVENDQIQRKENYNYAEDLSVMFVTVGVYYVIITDSELLNDLYHFVKEDRLDEADLMVRAALMNYAAQNFDEFSARVDKAIKTAHGVGVKKTTRKLLNAANRNNRKRTSRKRVSNEV